MIRCDVPRRSGHIQLSARTSGQPKAKLAPTPNARSNLSEREIELLHLARRGKRAKEIAVAMNLSYETIRTHFRNIYRKLHVHSLRSAVQKTFKD